MDKFLLRLFFALYFCFVIKIRLKLEGCFSLSKKFYISLLHASNHSTPSLKYLHSGENEFILNIREMYVKFI